MKIQIQTIMRDGRNASQSVVRSVYDFLYEQEESRKHGNLQGVSSAVFGMMNALLKRGGHLGFDRDERDAFNAWVGLPPVGTKSGSASESKVDALLSALEV